MTAASHDLWLAFIDSFTPADRTKWKTWTYTNQAVWDGDHARPAAGSAIRLVQTADHNKALILTTGSHQAGRLGHPLNPARKDSSARRWRPIERALP